MKKNKLIVHQDYSFTLLGIVASIKEYSLAWHLNQSDIFHFVKVADLHISYNNDSEMIISNYVCKSEQHTYTLFKNRLIISSFEGSMLLPELSQFDYFLKLESKIDHFDLDVLVDNLRVIDKIDYLARLDIKKIKNRENVLH